jgi:hypothetical protein
MTEEDAEEFQKKFERPNKLADKGS